MDASEFALIRCTGSSRLRRAILDARTADLLSSQKLAEQSEDR
jgi:hypothetical protein